MQMSEDNQGWALQPGQQSSIITKSVKLTTNLYEIRTDKLMSAFFKYEFLPAEDQTFSDSIQAFRNMNEKRKNFQKRINFVCEFKDGFLGSKRADGVIELLEERNNSLPLKIKLVDTFTLEQMLKEDCKFIVLRHLIQPIVKKCIENTEKITKKDYIGNYKIVLTPTFNFNFVELKKKIYLSTDVSINIRDDCTLMTYFERYKDQESHKKIMTNRQVIANYGSGHVYTIVDIDYAKTPQSLSKFGNKQCTFAQFYKEKHVINISDSSQCLLVATRRSPKEEDSQKVFLIPELVSFYNLINPNQMNEQVIQKIEKKKWQLPQQKEIYALRIVRQLGQNEIIKKSAHNFDGMVFNPPSIKIDGLSIVPKEGVFGFRGKIQKSVELKNWGLVYIEGKDQQADNNDISKLLFFMKGVCSQFGIRITNDPGKIAVKGDVNEWKTAIQEDIQRYGTPQFLLFLLRDEEIRLYNAFSQYILMQLKCPSQAVRRKKFDSDNKKPFNLAADILFQIETKIGGAVWQIGGNTELSKRKLMFGGIHLSKEKDGYSFSFVGYINPQGTQVYSFNKRGYANLSEINFELLFIHWAKNYVMNNKFSPDTIIIYRQFSGDTIAQEQIDNQLSQIKTAIKKIGEKTKTTNYNPSLSYLTMSQSHGLEIYSKAQNQQKELILENPEPGTIVIERNSDESSFSFFLNGCRDWENTVRPVKFTVFEGAGFNAESLICFTSEQCYNYSNYKGAISVPACIQYARRLEAFSKKTSVQLGYEEKMTRTLYFI